MPVIALQGIRGGVGTTSVTAGLAWALQQLEESVLIIDLAPDNLLRLHFNMPFEQSRGWARACIDNTSWQQSAMRYTPLLDFLPFGKLSPSEYLQLETHLQQTADWWSNNLSELIKKNSHRWILLDLPANNRWLAAQTLTQIDNTFIVLTPDAACQARLHQQTFPPNCHFLVNQYFYASLLQRDIYQLWQQTLNNLLPLMLHRDESFTEALAVKQPVGEYHSHSLVAEELLTLANWCLIHMAK